MAGGLSRGATERRGIGGGWGAPRYAAPTGFHRGALALALAGPLLGALVLALGLR